MSIVRALGSIAIAGVFTLMPGVASANDGYGVVSPPTEPGVKPPRSSSLPNTGADALTTTLGAAGAVLLLGGGTAVVVSRRRRTETA